MGYWKGGEELNKGKFVVEELLGSGGFGVTYRIKQSRTNKIFALKTLNELARNKPEFPQLQSKFINEAIALASCSHPNIVKVYPQGFQEGELWCMVMEYVEGKDLSHHLDKDGKFEEEKAVEIIRKVGEALDFVHQQGLLHRDIKPGNILLRKLDSTPVLIDFGLAREYNANPDSIRSMTNSMTESFAPIEQYQRYGKFGAWTDVYALAATLYVLTTKQLPFPAKFREHAPLVAPQKHNAELRDHINEAIVKGLELQPGDRPQTVQAWLKMLKPPQPKPEQKAIIEPEFIDPTTQIVAPKKSSPKQKVTAPKQTPVEARNKPQQKVERVDSSSRKAQENVIGDASERSPIKQKKNERDEGSKTVSRRNWLKYSGLAVASMIVTLIGKEIIDNSSQTQDNSDLGKSTDETIDSSIQSDSLGKQTEDAPQPTNNDLELAEYEFDVIRVNDKGEEINREKGSAKYFTEDLGNGIVIEMVEIPSGSFMMGSPEDELERDEDESPQHEVTVTSFHMGKYEVTQAQWKAVVEMPQIERELKLDPSRFKGDDLPVERVSWYDAVEFCKRLSKATGREYRLPSEAEWEYACRAGTTTPFYFGDTITTELVNYRGTDLEFGDTVFSGNYGSAPKGEYREKTTSVESFPPNAFGLYDMHGNVLEWCADNYQENYQGAPNDGSTWILDDSSKHVLRGGSWNSLPRLCRSAYRYRDAPDYVSSNLGCRCCMATRTL